MVCFRWLLLIVSKYDPGALTFQTDKVTASYSQPDEDVDYLTVSPDLNILYKRDKGVCDYN